VVKVRPLNKEKKLKEPKEMKQKKLVRDNGIILREFDEMKKSGVVIDKEAREEVSSWVDNEDKTIKAR